MGEDNAVTTNPPNDTVQSNSNLENQRAGTPITLPTQSTEQSLPSTPTVQSPVSLQPNSNSTSTLSLTFPFNSVEDSTRMLANNISSTIGEISPLITLSRSRPALSIQEWLNPNRQRQVPQQQQQQPQSPTAEQHTDSVVINVDGNPTEFSGEPNQLPNESNDQRRSSSFSNSFNNNAPEGSNPASPGNGEANPADAAITISTEARAAHRTIDSYVPFFMIILTKGVYDNAAEILNLLILVITFIQANNDLKREIMKQNNRSRMVLLGILCYIIGCFVFINFVYVFVFTDQTFLPYSPPTTMWQLVWTVAVTDYILKLVTVGVKVLLTLLPVCILPIQKRGKFYLLIEATSQLYRSGAPLKPWLYYLSGIYQGSDKMLGMILFVMYSIHKGGDMMSHIKQFFSAVWKLLQNVSLGVSPTKEQIAAAGGTCAICHEEYSMPVRLHCKHIFCESCVTTWLDRERSCPLCRASITDDPIYRDGHTTHYVQLY